MSVDYVMECNDRQNKTAATPGSRRRCVGSLTSSWQGSHFGGSVPGCASSIGKVVVPDDGAAGGSVPCGLAASGAVVALLELAMEFGVWLLAVLARTARSKRLTAST